MIREINGQKFFFVIPSVGRPQNVPKMVELMGEATWIVRPEEEAEYRRYGATSFLYQKGLCHARNAGLEEAFKLGLPCLQSDDDVKSFAKLHKGERVVINFDEFFTWMFKSAQAMGAKLAGMNPVDNPFYASTRINRTGFIIASIFLAFPSDIRFDEELPMKEDYDYTLQHLERYGHVARVDWLLATYQHYTNAGGIVDARNPEREQRAIKRLKEKWGSIIKYNRKRENEVLMHWDRERYALWQRRQRYEQKPQA